ncbi:MAG: electron transfer flavoprotein subunit alpha/FixB family protein [Nitrososphaerota archaeon]|nr:electron transfer flavoprotein subunit alpha/FixB family protein [Candidatus Bathyarchaeota archaeon]MDW8023700.1 electron transfer flavoprotein subunit alpha/FixB family protein [Nitrososphaerota archaeon]
MAEVFVLAEHRQGQIREITFEMLSKGLEIAQKIGAELSAVLLGKDVKGHAEALANYASKVLLVQDATLADFNSEVYQRVLSKIMMEHKPILTMIGHTSYGMELAPRLAVALNIPLATDCIDIAFEGEKFTATRQMYGGKVNVKVALRKAESYMVTIRQATFTAKKPVAAMNGKIIEKPSPPPGEPLRKQFIEYVLPPPSGVDITAAEKIVAVGRGIKDKANIPIIEELAQAIGGVLACSRPIVDKGWLPSERQVGSSGKTVKPKLYMALGISGAFQHIMGMKGSDLIIAVNKDPKAPIYSYADYGVVEDLFKVVPSLREKIYELKPHLKKQP